MESIDIGALLIALVFFIISGSVSGSLSKTNPVAASTVGWTFGLIGVAALLFPLRNLIGEALSSATATTPTTGVTTPFPITPTQIGIGLVALIAFGILAGGVYNSVQYIVVTPTVPSGPGAPPPPPSNWVLLGKYAAMFGGFFLILYLLMLGSSVFDKPGTFMPSSLFRMLYYFLPYGLTTYTVISDILNLKYKYSGAVITSIAGFVINHLAALVLTRDIDKTSNPLKDSNYCGIPGLGRFGSNIFPQGMLFNLTSLSYLATYITAETERDSKYTIPAWTFLIATFAASSAITNHNGCFEKETNGYGYALIEYFKAKGWDINAAKALQNLATLAASIALGSLGAGIHIGIFGSKEHFAGHIDPKAEKKADDKKDENIVNVSTALSEVCPAIAEDQIVAEIYQNGKKLGSSQN